jgi:hypothetical protein
MEYYPDFGTIWYNLFDIGTLYYKTSYEHTKCFHYLVYISETYDKHVSDLLNSTCYETYFGNFAHGIIQKITHINSSQTDFPQKVCPLIHLLLKMVNLGYVDINRDDYYGLNPYQTVLRELPQNVAEFRILSRVLNPNYNVVVVCQTLIRRWLAKRKVQAQIIKNKYSQVIDSIKYAPKYQLESYIFPTFPGGCGYIASMHDFEERAIHQLVEICT